MKLYYDIEYLKGLLRFLNPINPLKFFTKEFDSIVVKFSVGCLVIISTFLVWLILPILFLMPIKVKYK